MLEKSPPGRGGIQVHFKYLTIALKSHVNKCTLSPLQISHGPFLCLKPNHTTAVQFKSEKEKKNNDPLSTEPFSRRFSEMSVESEILTQPLWACETCMWRRALRESAALGLCLAQLRLPRSCVRALNETLAPHLKNKTALFPSADSSLGSLIMRKLANLPKLASLTHSLTHRNNHLRRLQTLPLSVWCTRYHCCVVTLSKIVC